MTRSRFSSSRTTPATSNSPSAPSAPGSSPNLTVAASGADALAHLRRAPGVAVSRTQLILLDLYLPDMSGFDLLVTLRADPRLRQIPVVVLTSSETEVDVVRSYDLQASGYVTTASRT